MLICNNTNYEPWYRLKCDICDKIIDGHWHHWEDAGNHKKRYGWKTEVVAGVVSDICPDCAKAGGWSDKAV